MSNRKARRTTGPTNRAAHYSPDLTLRALFALQGRTARGVEKETELARGSVQRILDGRRGGDSIDTALKLAKVLRLPLETVVVAMRTGVAEAQHRRRLILEAERARLLAAEHRYL